MAETATSAPPDYGNSVNFAAGCVVKFKTNAYLLSYGTITCPSACQAMAVLTSRNDDDWGEPIVGVSGEANSDDNPTKHLAKPALWSYYSPNNNIIENLRIRWAKTGIQVDRNSSDTATLQIRDCIFEDITGTGTVAVTGDLSRTTASNNRKCNVLSSGVSMTLDCTGIENGLPGDSSWELGSNAATAGWPGTHPFLKSRASPPPPASTVAIP